MSCSSVQLVLVAYTVCLLHVTTKQTPDLGMKCEAASNSALKLIPVVLWRVKLWQSSVRWVLTEKQKPLYACLHDGICTRQQGCATVAGAL